MKCSINFDDFSNNLIKDRNPKVAQRLENSIFGATGHKIVTKSKKGTTVFNRNP
jgi:hypothetical protein